MLDSLSDLRVLQEQLSFYPLMVVAKAVDFFSHLVVLLLLLQLLRLGDEPLREVQSVYEEH